MNAAVHKGQAGFTLVELIVATAIGTLVMGALVSIVLTVSISSNIATTRADASAQIRNFQLAAYDDLALSSAPTGSGCGTASNPCTSQPIVLQGMRVPNQVTGSPGNYSVTYTWSPDTKEVTRQAGTSSRTVTRDVTGFSWYVDTSGDHPVVVVILTVTESTYNASYSETQTFRFLPRVTAP